MDQETNKRLGELLFALAYGNIDALSQIYVIMCKILYAIGNIYFPQKADIEDSIQDLLMALYDKAGKFKENKNAYAWIIGIYRNSIKNKLRQKKRESNYISHYIANESEKTLSCEDDLYLDNYLFIREIFSKLTEQERDLIIYRYWCNCSIAQVADIMKKPKSTIDSQLKRLEEKIKKF
jgi:RNA polymerase sigma-70 factor (ECF subfamily)